MLQNNNSIDSLKSLKDLFIQLLLVEYNLQ